VDPVVTRTPDGRVEIVEVDDRDTAYPLLVTAPANILGLSGFSEVYRFPLERARRGQLILSANVATTAAFVNQYVYIEVNVIAYLASAPILVHRTGLDANINLVTFDWDVPSTYGAIGIQAREVVDGLPSSINTGISALQLSAAGFYWR